jgi:SAM-dependent methyltransferase
MRIEGRSLAELRDQAETTVMIAAAHAAGVFQALREGTLSAAEVARRSGFDARAVAILLPALEDVGLLERDGDGFRPTPSCRDGLCDPSSEDFVGGGLAHWLRNLGAWTRLDEVLMKGGPLRPAGGQRDRADLARFMSAMAAAPVDRVRRLVDGCLRRASDPRAALDVGGGPGHMSREFVRRGLHATLFDTPETVEFVREAYGLGAVDGMDLVGGDFTVDPLPDGPFDVVLLSNVIHIYGPDRNRRLIAEAARVTAPGGVVAVQDFVRGRSGRAARFALVMLLRTEEGNTYGETEISGWMAAAGLDGFQVEDLDPDRQLVTAVRP